MKIPKHYSLFETGYSEEIAAEQIYIIKFEKLPSSRVDKTSYDASILQKLKDLGFKKITTLQKVRFRLGVLKEVSEDQVEESLLTHDTKEIIIKTKKNNKTNKLTLNIYYSIDKGDVETQLDLSFLKDSISPNTESNISLIRSHGGGYWDLEDYELNQPNVDLETNYGDGFKEINDIIVKRLNTENDKGIVLLHGEPGTGKTTYIKYLTKEIKDKKIIFVPPMMAESLTDPAIIPFLMDHKNSILIIEDAEKVLGSRESNNGTSQSTSNLLNLTDGILGDCLNIQIIATFNTKRENIDEAFLRKGRLIAEYKFNKLSVETGNKLLKSLGKEVTIDEEMVLSDLYNIDVDIYKSINGKNKIGFN